MDKDLTPPRLLTPLWLGIAALTAALTGFGTWMVFARTADRHTIPMLGSHASLGRCIAAALRADSRLGTAGAPPSVSVLTHAESGTTRIIIGGEAPPGFTITLTEFAPGKSEARLAAFPPFESTRPAAEAVEACAGR